MDQTKESKNEEPSAQDKQEKVTESEEKVDNHGDEGSQDEDGGAQGASGWWGGYSSWVNKAVATATATVSTAAEAAKQKSNEVYGLVSKDLEEVSTQATGMVKSTSMTLKKTLEQIDEKSDKIADQAYDSVKTSVTSAWRYAAGYATQMFSEEDLEAEALLVQGDQREPVIMNRLQAQLYALATDPDTFLTDPHAEDQEQFQAWKCDLDKRQGEISDLMVNNSHIRQNYSNLVPDKVNHNLFWTRYFFKVHLIEIQESKRQVLKKRAAENASNDDDINWDDVADLAEASGVEKDIPDEVQDQLLNEYEKELIEAKVKKTSKNLKKELNIKEKQTSPDKEETSSDDWEKLSSGEKSPRKPTKEEEEDWVQP